MLLLTGYSPHLVFALRPSLIKPSGKSIVGAKLTSSVTSAAGAGPGGSGASFLGATLRKGAPTVGGGLQVRLTAVGPLHMHVNILTVPVTSCSTDEGCSE
jgi:hypothetical protein